VSQNWRDYSAWLTERSRELIDLTWLCCDDLGSADYQSAVRETKALFPDGLCCDANPDLTAEQVTPHGYYT